MMLDTTKKNQSLLLRTMRRAGQDPSKQRVSSVFSHNKHSSSPSKPFVKRKTLQKKHVLFALAAGAWCLLSVTFLLLESFHFHSSPPPHLEATAMLSKPSSKKQQQQQQQQDRQVHIIIGINTHDPTIPLRWNANRAFALLQDNFQPPFGFTMRDLARRVLSRHVANSNVLVIAPDARQQALDYKLPHNDVVLDSSVDLTMSPLITLGGTFVLHAQEQGHVTHAMNAGWNVQSGDYSQWNTTLDTWWAHYDDTKKRPNWILLAVVDPGLGWEDLVWHHSRRFLEESTITYIVTAIRSRLLDDGTLEIYGMNAIKTLLEKRYKMQILQVSHYHVEFDQNGNDKQQHPTTFQQHGPNALLKNEHDVESFLWWGAEAAKRYSKTKSPIFTAYLFGTQGLDLAIPSRRHYIRDDSRIQGEESWTQINLYRPVEFYPCPTTTSKVSVEIEFEKLRQESRINVKLVAPPEFNDEWTMQMRARFPLFRKLQNTWRDVCHVVHDFYYFITTKGITVTSTVKGTFFKRPITNGQGIETHFCDENGTGSLQLWYDENDPTQSEAACARYKDVVTCETRIIHKPDTLWRTFRRVGQLRQGPVAKNLDLLVIMLDPMSRGQLRRSMPQTKALLEELGFLQFTSYSAVGDNSGPNQAALYSGKPLADRDGIASDGNSEWLWDTLRNAGYATLKGEDGCIENSNMLQSLKPNTTHGEALNQMFCFDFNRPNCLGSKPAASYLLRYGRQFIDVYGSDTNIARQPWAAFLHFVDSHEDTSTLSTLLDGLLAKFLRETFDSRNLDNATVMMISDHGLHYGPHFQTLSGRRERTEPLLYIRTPTRVRDSSQGHIMEENAPLWTTPFDVHQTMIDLTVGRKDGDTTDSLLTKLPDSRRACRETPNIPERFCDLHDVFDGKAEIDESCPKTPQPPSILSFYADIPKSHRPMLVQPNCSKTKGDPFDFASECVCGTRYRDIYPCREHPWGADGINSTEYEEEYFAIVKCPNRVERLDSRVMRRQEFVDRYKNQTKKDIKKSKAGEERTRSPDILVLEIDSVSKAYAERHLPMTVQFLRKHQVWKDDNDTLHCTDGICALDFERFAVVGANSVANQVPALSGCVVSRFHESCFDQKYSTDRCYENGLFGTPEGCEACPVGMFPIDPLSPCNTSKAAPEKCCTDVFPSYNVSRICRDESLFEHGLQLFRRGPRRHTTWCPARKKAAGSSSSTPWIFDVARAKGYITYFGEEFCYDYSPYVTQDNTFPLYTDYELRNVYCRLQSCLENCEGPWPPMGPHICLEKDGENPAFTQISSIWDAYPDVPKFAFLNGIAAHDYDFEWIKMIASLEAYDVQLSSFLNRITSSPNFANTIIVVRTDHGLQGGPTTVDYSVQVEHRQPWMQIIIPEKLAGDSLSPLATNQDRLATGFDLYHSFRNLMSSGNAAPIPNWSIDFFREEISIDRSCRDAKIPGDFCPCDDTSLDRAPHFGVCNVFEPYNDLFCASDLDSPILPERMRA